MKEYKQELINIPVYGKANFVFPNIWNLPQVDTNLMTGSKVVACGRSVQFRFSCARTTEAAQMIRAYKLALDKDARSGVRFNYAKTGSVFAFQTTFCGSLSGLKKFEGFIERLASLSSIKSVLVRIRQEDTRETSNFKRFEYNKSFLKLVGYLRDNLDIKAYNSLNMKELEVMSGQKPLK